MFAPPSGPLGVRPASASRLALSSRAAASIEKPPVTPVGWPFANSALGYPHATKASRAPVSADLALNASTAPRSPTSIVRTQHQQHQYQQKYEHDLVESLAGVWSEGKQKHAHPARAAQHSASTASLMSASDSSQSLKPKKAIVCALHKSRLQQFCVDCQVALCVDCLTLGVHAGHRHASISRAAADARPSLHQLIAEVENAIGAEYAALENLDQVRGMN